MSEREQAGFRRSGLIAVASLLAVCIVGPCLAAEPEQASSVRASKLIGMQVRNDRDEKLGRVDDLIMSRSGTISRVIVAVDGSKLVAVPYKDVKVSASSMVYATTLEKLQGQPEFKYSAQQAADTTDRERERYADQAQQRMSEWESRLDQAKKSARDGASEAGRKLDSALSDVKDKWADVESASNDGWKRAKTDFERAWRNLERTWKETTR